MLKRFFAVLAAALICFALSGCKSSVTSQNLPDEKAAYFTAMDTYMTVRAYTDSDELIENLKNEAYRLEKLLSVTDENSEVYSINKNSGGSVSKDTQNVLTQSLGYCEMTDGALDITVYPLVSEWGFTTGIYKIPSTETINKLLQSVNYKDVAVTDGKVELKAGAKIDLGAVAKGYLGDVLIKMLKDGGTVSGILDLGGCVFTLGKKPDGSEWRVSVKDPKTKGNIGVLETSDRTVATSGGYERYFTDDSGNVLWHILDPKTGYPAKSGLVSVTVIGESGIYCDALSTALFVMGEAEALTFWREHGDFQMILINDKNEIVITEGIKDGFEQNKSLDYTLRVESNA